VAAAVTALTHTDSSRLRTYSHAALVALGLGRLSIFNRPGKPLRHLQRRALVLKVNRINALVEENYVALLVGRDGDSGHVFPPQLGVLSSWAYLTGFAQL
jgi:hypothetical protein